MKHPDEQGLRTLGALTSMERAVSAMIANGLTNKEIAEILGTSEDYIKTLVSTIYSKIGFNNRTKYAVFIVRRPWMERELRASLAERTQIFRTAPVLNGTVA